MLKYLAKTFSISVTVAFAILAATWPMRADMLDGAMVLARNILPPNIIALGNYTIQLQDCFRPMVIMGTGTSPQATVTLPSATSLPNGCLVTVKNGDIYTGTGTGHAMTPSGFPSDIPSFLWPQQVTKQVATTIGWQTAERPGRWKIPQETEICVDASGSDSNDGLSAGTSCFQHIQTASNVIYQQWDANNFPPDIGLYNGPFNEAVGIQGQITGYNFIRYRTRAANTWTNTAACIAVSDNAEAIFDATFGFTQTWQCNTANAANTGAIYGHQINVKDVSGAHKWISGGANDSFLFEDGEGRSTINGTGAGIIIGNTGTTSGFAFVTCNYHCAGVTIGGTLSWGGTISLSAWLVAKGGSVIDHSANPTGTPGTIGVALSLGNSVIRLNGLTPPGGTPTASFQGVCATTC